MTFKKHQGGFTLIELMIVVAIIGILAAVAIPAYQDYVAKAKISNAITSVGALRSAVALCAQESGALTTCDTTGTTATSIPAFSATKEVASATVTDGIITITLATGINSSVDGKTITLTPTLGASALTWFASTNITDTTLKAMIEKNNRVVPVE